MGRNESPLLQNLLSHHHSKIIDGSHAEEGLQSPRCRPTQPLFRSTTFLLNLNMSFATYTKNITKLNNIQRIAHKHTPTTSQLHTSHTRRNPTGTRLKLGRDPVETLLKPGQNPLSPHPGGTITPGLPPHHPLTRARITLCPCPYHPVNVCIHTPDTSAQ